MKWTEVCDKVCNTNECFKAKFPVQCIYCTVMNTGHDNLKLIKKITSNLTDTKKPSSISFHSSQVAWLALSLDQDHPTKSTEVERGMILRLSPKALQRGTLTLVPEGY